MAADRIYYNVVINGTKQHALATYSETFPTPLLLKPSKYYLSIIRFLIPGQALPLFVMPVVANQPNVNLTPFVVSVGHNGDYYQENVIYTPASNFFPPSDIQTSAVNFNKPASEYYFVYSVDLFLKMINTAISAAVSAVPGNSADPPRLIYDRGSELISLIVPQTFIQAGYTLSINDLLFKYLDNFAYFFHEYPVPGYSDIHYTFEILQNPEDAYALPGDTITTPPAYYKQTQEAPCMPNWVDLKSIEIRTSTVPVKHEVVPTNSGTNIPVSTGAVGLPTQSILTDFQPSFSSLKDFRGIFQYYPQGPLRLINLMNDTPLGVFDIQLFWRDRYNNTYPLEIPIGFSADFKIAFIKRDSVKHDERY